MVDRVDIGNEPNPDAAAKQAEHDAAMAAKAEAGVSSISSVNKETGEDIKLQKTEGDTAPAKTERPADIPEKFWDAEKGEVNVPALLKAQQDAEAALRRAQQGKPPEGKTEEGKTEEGDKPSADDAQDNAVARANKEFAEKGELSEGTYKALDKVGLDRATVDAYIAGQQAIVSQLETAAFGAFDGTREAYQQATKWAAANLSDEEIAALDVQLTSTNPAIVRQGAKALAERYKAEADITPSRQITGDASSANTGAYFKSAFELTKAMSDPRYAKDEAYRHEVAQKIDRAVKAGVKLYG